MGVVGKGEEDCFREQTDTVDVARAAGCYALVAGVRRPDGLLSSYDVG